MSLVVISSRNPGERGGLPPPPDEPGDRRWDDEPDPERRAFNAVLAQVEKYFEPQPWFAGVGIAGFPSSGSTSEIADSLPIDERFRGIPKGFKRVIGIVIQVLDRSPEQLEEIKAAVRQLLLDLNAPTISFVVFNRSPIDEVIAHESGKDLQDRDLKALREHPLVAAQVIHIQSSRYPTGPFWFVVPDSLSDDEISRLSAKISEVISRRFEIFTKSKWESVMGRKEHY